MSADYKALLGLVREFVEWQDGWSGHDNDGPSEDLLDRARAAIAPSEPKPTNDPKILHMGVDDPCCGKYFSKEAGTGKLDRAEDWHCPRCTLRWIASSDCNVAGIIHWSAVPAIVSFKI